MQGYEHDVGAEQQEARTREKARRERGEVGHRAVHVDHHEQGRGDAAILADLKLASTAKQRQQAAMKHPELRPPHDALNDRENTILVLAFWQGLTYKEVGERFTLSAGRASQVANNALLKLTYHLHRGGSLGKATPGFPERLDELRRAHPIGKRLAVAARHPELRPPHTFLQPRENDVLERFYWQGQTFDTIARRHDLTRKQATKVRDDALRKLAATLLIWLVMVLITELTPAREGDAAPREPSED